MLNYLAEILKREDCSEQIMICTILGLKHVFPLVPPNDCSNQLLSYICGLSSNFDFSQLQT